MSSVNPQQPSRPRSPRPPVTAEHESLDGDAGVAAHTEFEVLSRFPDGTALLSVTPKTGRTNQIRVHLWHLGWPIVGDAMDRPGQQLGDVQTLAVGAAPLNLHAWQLTFSHPSHGSPVRFEAPKPAWGRV